MRIGLLRFSWIAALAASWGLTLATSATPAQERSGRGVLGSLTARKEAPRKSVEEDPLRAMEVQVELALLGDPVTFPYFLEAHVESSRLELRGFVPDKNVQEHALKLARLNSPLTVVDATRVHAGLAVKPTQLPPEKLYTSVHTALSKTLPASAKALRVECDSNGKVVVTGNVKNIEEKLAVSQSLRRLHGCGCVANMTQVDGLAGGPEPRAVASLPPVQKLAGPAPTSLPEKKQTDILPVQAREPAQIDFPAPQPAPERQADGPFGGFFGKMFGKRKSSPAAEAPPTRFPGAAAKDPVKVTNVGDPTAKNTGWGAPPRPTTVTATSTSKSGAGAPYEASGVIVAPTSAVPKKTARTLSPAQVKSRLESAFPKARPIAVTPEGGNKLKVELTAHSNEESNTIAGRLLALPELESYEVNLHIRIDAPAK